MSSKTGLFFVLFIALALFGAGCNKGDIQSQGVQPRVDSGGPSVQADASVEKKQDAENQIPEGWQIYRNPAWGIAQLAYPEGWYWRERTVEETGDPNSLWVDFNRDPIEPLIEADPVYPIAVVITLSTLEEVIAEYQAPDFSTEKVAIGDKSVVKASYTSDIIDAQVVAYLYAANGFVYNISGPESLSELATVVASLVTRR
ncbi:hypothetical protein HY477_00260 [Candidatus Uhrbacteria bacterium]|nr:hypothetical protein [Candidatus Uhrbacteria bacterium]